MSSRTKKEAVQDPPQRWSVQRKTEVVLRLLRGEDLLEVSREVRVPPPELEEWRRVFLENGRRGLKRRSRDPTERELVRTRAKLGEMTMRLELATELLEKRGFGVPLWLRSPRSWRNRTGARSPFSRISRSTRFFPARIPLALSRARTFRCPSLKNVLS